MTLSLLFETSIKTPFILLARNGMILKKILLDCDGLSDSFFPYLKRVLPSKEKLKFIATSVGPGSYTGIRVGVCAAKTFAYALNIPLLSFSSLETFIPPNPGSFLNLLDAKSGGVYSMQAEKTKEDCIFKKPQIHSIEEVKKLIQSFTLVSSLDSSLLKKRLGLSEIKQGSLDLNHLSMRLYHQFSRKTFTKDRELNLLYLR